MIRKNSRKVFSSHQAPLSAVPVPLLAGIKDHTCSTGYVGGFVDRLKELIWPM